MKTDKIMTREDIIKRLLDIHFQLEFDSYHILQEWFENTDMEEQEFQIDQIHKELIKKGVYDDHRKLLTNYHNNFIKTII